VERNEVRANHFGALTAPGSASLPPIASFSLSLRPLRREIDWAVGPPFLLSQKADQSGKEEVRKGVESKVSGTYSSFPVFLILRLG
jgi:hypothetical protein